MATTTTPFRFPTGMRLVRLLLGGWTGVVLALLYLPIGLLIVYSFNADRLNVRWTGFTFDWYRRLAENRPLRAAAWNSVVIAAWTTVIATALGTVGGWLLHRYRWPVRRLVGTLVFLPLIVPEVIMGISLLIFFALTTGLANDALAAAGVGPDRFRFGLGHTTVVISHVTFCFPFVLIAVQARLAGLDPSIEEAAMDLGATPLQAFRLVLVPYLLPAIVSGALMSFTLSMDELIVTYFTTGPHSRTLPIEIYGRVKRGLDPSLNAASTLFVAGTAVLVVAAEYLRRWRRE